MGHRDGFLRFATIVVSLAYSRLCQHCLELLNREDDAGCMLLAQRLEQGRVLDIESALDARRGNALGLGVFLGIGVQDAFDIEQSDMFKLPETRIQTHTFTVTQLEAMLAEARKREGLEN